MTAASWAVALVLLGVWSVTRVPMEWVPSVALPEIAVTATWPGASPRTVESEVTAPIERVVQQVAGTARIVSRSESGAATLTVSLHEHRDLGLYVAELGERLALLQRALPRDVAIRTERQVPEVLRDERGFMVVQIAGPFSPIELRRLAQSLVVPRLRSLGGLAEVTVQGGATPALWVTLDSDRLAAAGLDGGQVLDELARRTERRSYGVLQDRDGVAPLLAATPTTVEEIGRLSLVADRGRFEPVRLRDVARVALGSAPRETVSRIDGEPAVTLILDRAQGSHLLEVADSVRDVLVRLEEHLPGGVQLLIADDRSEQVRDELRDLAHRGGLGLVLVAGVLLGFLRSWRAALVVLASTVVAISIAFVLLEPLGLTLNLITLSGLVLLVGLLVDNGLVVTEQLLSELARSSGLGRSRSASVDRAVGAVWLPLLGGTLTTAAVVVPLVYLSGELRSLFLPLGVLVAVTLAASLLTSLVFIPAALWAFPRRPLRAWRWTRRVRRALEAPYVLAIRFPKSTLLAVILLFGVPVWLLPGPGELPGEDEPRPGETAPALWRRVADGPVRRALDVAFGGVLRPFVEEVQLGQPWRFEERPELSVSVRLPPGSVIEQTDRIIAGFENVAVGSGIATRTIATARGTQGELRVLFDEEELATTRPADLRRALIVHAGQLAGFELRITGLDPIPYSAGRLGSQGGYRLSLRGSDYDELEKRADEVAGRLERNPRIDGVNIHAARGSTRSPRDVVRIGWSGDAVARTALDARAVTDALAPWVSGPRPALSVDLGRAERVPLFLSIQGAEDGVQLPELLARPIALSGRRTIRLDRLANVATVRQPPVIEREDQQYVRTLEVPFKGPAALARRVLETEVARTALPPGYRLEMDEVVLFEPEERRQVGWILAGTAVVVLLAMAAVFDSWGLPLVVLLSSSTMFIGFAVGHLWLDMPLVEGTFIGLVLLIGIAVNDSMLLTGRYRQLTERLRSAPPAVCARLALRGRIRPMWTTTLTTIAGLIPLLLTAGEEDFWFALSLAIVSGLAASTLLAPAVALALLGLRRAPGAR